MSILRENPTVLSVTEATAKGVAGLVKAAEAGEDIMVERHRKPVAAVIGVERLRRVMVRTRSTDQCRGGGTRRIGEHLQEAGRRRAAARGAQAR